MIKIGICPAVATRLLVLLPLEVHLTRARYNDVSRIDTVGVATYSTKAHFAMNNLTRDRQ